MDFIYLERPAFHCEHAFMGGCGVQTCLSSSPLDLQICPARQQSPSRGVTLLVFAIGNHPVSSTLFSSVQIFVRS